MSTETQVNEIPNAQDALKQKLESECEATLRELGTAMADNAGAGYMVRKFGSRSEAVARQLAVMVEDKLADKGYRVAVIAAKSGSLSTMFDAFNVAVFWDDETYRRITSKPVRDFASSVYTKLFGGSGEEREAKKKKAIGWFRRFPTWGYLAVLMFFVWSGPWVLLLAMLGVIVAGFVQVFAIGAYRRYREQPDTEPAEPIIVKHTKELTGNVVLSTVTIEGRDYIMARRKTGPVTIVRA